MAVSFQLQIAGLFLLGVLIIVFMKMVSFEKRLQNIEASQNHYVTYQDYWETFQNMWDEKSSSSLGSQVLREGKEQT